jgi:hypothetical protein
MSHESGSKGKRREPTAARQRRLVREREQRILVRRHPKFLSFARCWREADENEDRPALLRMDSVEGGCHQNLPSPFEGGRRPAVMDRSHAL